MIVTIGSRFRVDHFVRSLFPISHQNRHHRTLSYLFYPFSIRPLLIHGQSSSETLRHAVDGTNPVVNVQIEK